jgi:transposase
MSRRPIPIQVKSKDLSQIGELLRGGIQQVRVVLRALSLRQLADGFTAPEVAQALPLTAKAVRQIAHRYTSDGLDAAVYAKERPGAQEVLDGPQKQRIVAMVCSKPPEGRARWTVRLIAEEAGQAQVGAQGGPRDNPDFVAEPRIEAVAGKTCGA